MKPRASPAFIYECETFESRNFVPASIIVYQPGFIENVLIFVNKYFNPVVSLGEVVGALKEDVGMNNRKVFICEICSFSSNSRAYVRKHVTLTHSANCPKFHCSLCGVVIKGKGNMKRHYVQVHLMTDEDAICALSTTVHM